MSGFDELELDESLIKATAELGYERATSIQTLAIPPAMDSKDVLASAPTGTGKTAAFLLPALQHLLDFPRKAPGSARVMILAPTRELAEQIYKAAKQLALYTEIDLGLITGGINYGTHKELVEKNLDLLVATPGRLLEYIEAEVFDCRSIEMLILDEADRMLDMGFLPIMDRIAAEARWRKQTLLFSATLEGRGLEEYAKTVLNEPERVIADPSRREKNKIHQWVHLADNRAHKSQIILHYLNQEEVTKAIIFVKTREQVTELSTWLHQNGHNVYWIQGDMQQHKRKNAVQSLAKGKVKAIVATDVAARGLDIDDISHVFNFDMPRGADVYLHRIGRTGRAGKKGTAISLVEAHDMEMWGKAERYTDEKIRKRVVKGLEPKHKPAKVPAKKKKPTKTSKTKGKAKVRARVKKNVGKPNRGGNTAKPAAKG